MRVIRILRLLSTALLNSSQNASLTRQSNVPGLTTLRSSFSVITKYLGLRAAIESLMEPSSLDKRHSSFDSSYSNGSGAASFGAVKSSGNDVISGFGGLGMYCSCF